MKSLLLMRHAEADAAAIGQGDRERVLSALGHAQASAAGRVLKRAKLLPDPALCSAVIRAHRTAQDLGSAAGLACSIETDDSLYSASAEHLLNLLSVQPDSAQQLLLVVHAPGVTAARNLNQKALSGPLSHVLFHIGDIRVVVMLNSLAVSQNGALKFGVVLEREQIAPRRDNFLPPVVFTVPVIIGLMLQAEFIKLEPGPVINVQQHVFQHLALGLSRNSPWS